MTIDAIIFDDMTYKGKSEDYIASLLSSEDQIIQIRFFNTFIPKNTVKGITSKTSLEILNPSFNIITIKRTLISYNIPEKKNYLIKKRLKNYLVWKIKWLKKLDLSKNTKDFLKRMILQVLINLKHKQWMNNHHHWTESELTQTLLKK